MTPSHPSCATKLFSFCFVLGCFLIGFFVYKGILVARMADRYVTAKGLAEQMVKSDRGTWTGIFKIAGNDLSVLRKQLDKDVHTVQEFLKKVGFDAQEVSVDSPRVTDLHAKEYTSGPPTPERYIIEYSVEVKSSKVDMLESFSKKTIDLLNHNLNLTDSHTYYYLDRFGDLRPFLIEEAARNAQKVAESFANNTGSFIGGVRKANQGTIQVLSPDATPSMNYDSGLSSLTKKLRVVSTIDFYLVD